MNAKQGRRPRLFTSAAGAPVRLLGSAGKEKGSGARDLRDDDAHGEEGQWELWEVSTSDDMLQAPAMARRRRTSRRRRVCGVGGAGTCTCAGKGRDRARSRLLKRGGG
jgi:hypothetical protein